MSSGEAGRFSVDPHALHEMSRSMALLGAYLDGARATGREADESTFGECELASAVRAFVEHWEWLSKKVSQHLSDTADHLSTAASNYQQVEDAQKAAEGLA